MTNIYAVANAVGINTDGYEADSTDGWTSSGVVFESQSNVKAVSNNTQQAFKISATGTPTAGARIIEDLNDFCTVGQDYALLLYARHIGDGGEWVAFLAASGNAEPSPDVLYINHWNSGDTSFLSSRLGWTHSVDKRYLIVREDSGTNDGGMYLDNMELQVMPSYYVDTTAISNGDGASWTTPWNSFYNMWNSIGAAPGKIYNKYNSEPIRHNIKHADSIYKWLYMDAIGVGTQRNNSNKQKIFGSYGFPATQFLASTGDEPANTYFYDFVNLDDSAHLSGIATHNRHGVWYTLDDWTNISTLKGAFPYNIGGCTSGYYYLTANTGVFGTGVNGRLYINIGEPLNSSAIVEVLHTGACWETETYSNLYGADCRFAENGMIEGNCWGWITSDCEISYCENAGWYGGPDPSRTTQLGIGNREAYSWLRRNYIHHVRGPGIMTVTTANGLRVESSIIHGCGYGFWTIGTKGTFYNHILNCTIYDNSQGIVVQPVGANMQPVIVYNTISVNNGTGDFVTTGSGEYIDLVADYNLTTSVLRYGGIWSQGGNDVIGDPLFTDVSNDDFSLSVNSPAIDSGINNSIINDIILDFDRKTRPRGLTYDIGAFEYGGNDIFDIRQNSDTAVTGNVNDLKMVVAINSYDTQSVNISYVAITATDLSNKYSDRFNDRTFYRRNRS